jgi:atypical dual specificity phosphatase
MLAFTTPTWKKQTLTNPTISVATLRSRSQCADEIIPRLYLGDFSTATDYKKLESMGVTHIVCCMEDAPTLKKVDGKELKRLHIPVSDVPSTDLARWFEQTNPWIGEALEDEKNVVLVHCLMVRASRINPYNRLTLSHTTGYEVCSYLLSISMLDPYDWNCSRSATIVAAYLIWTRHLHATDAISFVRARRRIVRPNLGFVNQLESYSDSIDRGPEAKSPPPDSSADTLPATEDMPYLPNDVAAIKVSHSLAAKIRRYMANAGTKKAEEARRSDRRKSVEA